MCVHQSARDLTQISDLQAQLEEATKEKQEIQEKVQDNPQLPAEHFRLIRPSAFPTASLIVVTKNVSLPWLLSSPNCDAICIKMVGISQDLKPSGEIVFLATRRRI